MPKSIRNRLLIYLLILGSCKTNTQGKLDVAQADVVVFHPTTPAKDSLQKWCTIEFTDLEIVSKSDSRNYDSFSIQNHAFSGWACQIFEDNAHRYRFHQIENGRRIRQVYYYVNGVVDCDFYTDWSKGYNSERMWMADGKPYIENYFISPGVMHGLQRRWYSNNILAKEAVYNNGKLIYELEYIKSGELVSTKGTVPSNKKK